MDKKISIGVIAISVLFSIFVLTSPSDPIPLPSPNPVSENSSVKIIAENLDKPRSIAISENRIFVTEKDRKSTRLNSSHVRTSRMPSSA